MSGYREINNEKVWTKKTQAKCMLSRCMEKKPEMKDFKHDS